MARFVFLLALCLLGLVASTLAQPEQQLEQEQEQEDPDLGFELGQEYEPQQEEALDDDDNEQDQDLDDQEEEDLEVKQQSKLQPAQPGPVVISSHVYDLTNETMDSIVGFIHVFDHALIELYTPSCPHCQRLAPECVYFQQNYLFRLATTNH
jgi:thiol-disulfide isomerase/thioredoxin